MSHRVAIVISGCSHFARPDTVRTSMRRHIHHLGRIRRPAANTELAVRALIHDTRVESGLDFVQLRLLDGMTN